MLNLITNIQAVGRLWLNGVVKPVMSSRAISVTPNFFGQPEIRKLRAKEKVGHTDDKSSFVNNDRSIKIPVETSIKYMESEAYKTTYGDELIWKLYRRNFKGQFAPRKTRRTCVRAGVVSTGSPCPICRDEYLVIDPSNTKLLNQFISQHNGEILSYQITNICQRQYKHLLVAIQLARNRGILTYDPPIRKYNYFHWYKPKSIKN